MSGVVNKLKALSAQGLVRAACYVGIVAMALMAWSVLEPRPLPVMMAMTVGQAGAVLAFLLYLAGIVLPHRAPRQDREKA